MNVVEWGQEESLGQVVAVILMLKQWKWNVIRFRTQSSRHCWVRQGILRGRWSGEEWSGGWLRVSRMVVVRL